VILCEWNGGGGGVKFHEKKIDQFEIDDDEPGVNVMILKIFSPN
jgi:hypothetical protein